MFTHSFISGTGDIKVVIKDNFDIKGLVTTCGSKALSDMNAAKKNSEVVERIVASNQCSLVGRVTMHELAFGMTGINHWAGTPVNVRYPNLMPGGSSSGSAVAVASGIADFALGTDTGGSIRLPAACCGVYGFKPTFGRVSRKGVLPENSSLDCVSVLSSQVTCLTKGLSIIDPTFDWSIPDFELKQLRFAFPVIQLHPLINSKFTELLSQLFDESKAVEIKSLSDANEAARILMGTEMFTEFKHLLPYKKLGADVQKRLEEVKPLTNKKLHEIASIKNNINNELNKVFLSSDLLITPTLPSSPLTLSEVKDGKDVLSLSALVRPFNLSGNPSIAIPAGTLEGAPFSLQIIGPHGSDELVCSAAYLIKRKLVKFGEF